MIKMRTLIVPVHHILLKYVSWKLVLFFCKYHGTHRTQALTRRPTNLWDIINNVSVYTMKLLRW